MGKPLKIIFLGSGPIAVPILKALCASPLTEVAAVVTQPDRPAGRKRVLMPTPLGQAALELGIEPLRVTDVNAPDFLGYTALLRPKMICVVSFGQLLKAPLLALPEKLCVNVHASLLPAYRGASPIASVILNRERSTGVCFMEMERGLDSGAVFRRLELPLKGDEYADSLEMKLGELAASVAPETLAAIAQGLLPPEIQDPSKVTVCRKISKAMGVVNWRKSAAEIEAMVRAFYPWPGASCRYRLANGKEGIFTICRAQVSSVAPVPLPGELLNVPGKLISGCGDNSALEILELIPSGGKRMTASAFRNGLRGEVPRLIGDDQL